MNVKMVKQITNSGGPGCQGLIPGCLKGGLGSKGEVIPASASRCSYCRRGCQPNQTLDCEVGQVVVDSQLQDIRSYSETPNQSSNPDIT